MEIKVMNPQKAKVVKPLKLKEAKVTTVETSITKPKEKVKGDETATAIIDNKMSLLKDVEKKVEEVLAKHPKLSPPVNTKRTEELIKWLIQQGY